MHEGIRGIATLLYCLKQIGPCSQPGVHAGSLEME